MTYVVAANGFALLLGVVICLDLIRIRRKAQRLLAEAQVTERLIRDKEALAVQTLIKADWLLDEAYRIKGQAMQAVPVKWIH